MHDATTEPHILHRLVFEPIGALHTEAVVFRGEAGEIRYAFRPLGGPLPEGTPLRAENAKSFAVEVVARAQRAEQPPSRSEEFLLNTCIQFARGMRP